MLLGSPPDMVHGDPPRRPVRPHILPCKKPGIGSAGHKGPKAAKLLYHRGQRFARRNLKFEEQGLGAGQRKVLEESRETSFKKFLWQGVGQSPTTLPLTLGGARNPKERQHLHSHSLSSTEAPNCAAHTPQHIARFRKLGKHRFPDFRREADALHRRWEAKRSREIVLTVRQGPNRSQHPHRKRHLAVTLSSPTPAQTACGSL